jgi:hypothetical protein
MTHTTMRDFTTLADMFVIPAKPGRRPDGYDIDGYEVDTWTMKDPELGLWVADIHLDDADFIYVHDEVTGDEDLVEECDETVIRFTDTNKARLMKRCREYIDEYNQRYIDNKGFLRELYRARYGMDYC